MHRTFTRRALLARSGALATAPLAMPWAAFAQGEYPTKPVKIIVATAAGSATDAFARQLAAALSTVLGQGFYVDNKAGAHGFIASEAAKSAAPDGYTLYMSAGGTMAVNPALYGAKLPYDPVKDFAPIAIVGSGPQFLAVPKDLPVANLKELVEYVKSRSGRVSYASSGNGSTANLLMELVKHDTGIQMQHVAYRGASAALTDLAAGRVACAFETSTALSPLLQSGRVRLIAVSTARRSKLFPDVPTLMEQGLADFEAFGWTALFAPASTPPAVIATLNRAVNKVVTLPEFIAWLGRTGDDAGGGTPEDLRNLLAREIAKWKVAVKLSGATPE